MGSELFCWLLLYGVVIHAASENKPLLSLTDSSVSVLARRQGFSQAEQELYQLPVVVWDGGEPLLSSTSTVTLRVCPCQRGARMPVCRAQAFLSSAGLSTGALIAILLCVLILLGKIEISRAKRRACFFVFFSSVNLPSGKVQKHTMGSKVFNSLVNVFIYKLNDQHEHF